MKVNSISNNIYKNQLLKKGLKFAADNGSLFAAGTSLALSTFVRPFSIMLTPNTDKENKKFACAKSIASSAAGYVLMLGASIPIARNAKKIDKNPEKYLKPETIKNLTEKSKPLIESKSYQFLSQMFKLGVSAVAAAPKSIMTCLMIPPIMGAIFKNKQHNKIVENKQNNNKMVVNDLNININPNNKPVSFTGTPKLSPIAKGMGKVMDNPHVQKFAEKFKDSNFAMHTMALTDTITTAAFVQQTKHNKKIDETRKKPLIYNATISTALSIAGGYLLDKVLDKPTEKFINKFSEVNKNDKNLSKYVEGIKIAKPTLILGTIYYAFIPILSTFLADRVDSKNSHIAQNTKNLILKKS